MTFSKEGYCVLPLKMESRGAEPPATNALRMTYRAHQSQFSGTRVYDSEILFFFGVMVRGAFLFFVVCVLGILAEIRCTTLGVVRSLAFSSVCNIPKTTIGTSLTFEVTDGKTLVFESPDFEDIPSYSLTDKPPWLSDECVNEITTIRGDGMASIGAYAFYGMQALQTAGFMYAFGDVGESAFEGCINLESIIDDAMFTVFQKRCFFGCAKLKHLPLDYGGRFGESCLEGCVECPGDGLTSFYITSISARAFAYSGLKQCDVGALGVIPEYLCYHCKRLTQINVDLSVDTIKEYAFAETMITSLTLGQLLATVYTGAFANCSELSQVTYLGSTELRTEMFVGCPKLKITGLSFPNGYDHLNFAGFSFCNFSGSVGTLKYSMLYGSNDLNMEGGDIADYPVYVKPPWGFCIQNVRTLTLGTGVTHVGARAFENGDVRVVNAPNVRSIGKYAFKSNYLLQEVNIQFPQLLFLGASAFEGCMSIKQVQLPHITSLPDYCFAYCSGLEKITWTKTITNIGIGAFYRCSSLEFELTLPAEMAIVSDWTFEGCSLLTSVKFMEPDPVQGSVGVADIRKRAFYDCRSLANVELPTSLFQMGEKVFEGTALTSVVIPAAVSYVGTDCFRNCSYLEHVEYLGFTEIVNDIFQDCSSLEQIVVSNEYPSAMFGGRMVTQGGQRGVISGPERAGIALAVVAAASILVVLVWLAIKGKLRCRNNRNALNAAYPQTIN